MMIIKRTIASATVLLFFTALLSAKPLSTLSFVPNTSSGCCYIDVQSRQYEVRWHNPENAANPKSFLYIPALTDQTIISAYYMSAKKNIVIVNYIDNSNGSRITRINCFDKNTCAMKWDKTIQDRHANVFENDTSLYFTGENYMAKLNIETGVFDWEHSGAENFKSLKDGVNFESFDIPDTDGILVNFKATPAMTIDQVVILVNEKTGEIIGAEKAVQ